MNQEHYQDPTAEEAIRRMLLKRALEEIATICGFKVHITFVEKRGTR